MGVLQIVLLINFDFKSLIPLFVLGICSSRRGFYFFSTAKKSKQKMPPLHPDCSFASFLEQKATKTYSGPKNQFYCLKSGNLPTAGRLATPALRDFAHKKRASAPSNSPDFLRQ